MVKKVGTSERAKKIDQIHTLSNLKLVEGNNHNTCGCLPKNTDVVTCIDCGQVVGLRYDSEPPYVEGKFCNNCGCPLLNNNYKITPYKKYMCED